jgi:hypothetical protein
MKTALITAVIALFSKACTAPVPKSEGLVYGTYLNLYGAGSAYLQVIALWTGEYFAIGELRLFCLHL